MMNETPGPDQNNLHAFQQEYQETVRDINETSTASAEGWENLNEQVEDFRAGREPEGEQSSGTVVLPPIRQIADSMGYLQNQFQIICRELMKSRFENRKLIAEKNSLHAEVARFSEQVMLLSQAQEELESEKKRLKSETAEALKLREEAERTIGRMELNLSQIRQDLEESRNNQQQSLQQLETSQRTIEELRHQQQIQAARIEELQGEGQASQGKFHQLELNNQNLALQLEQAHNQNESLRKQIEQLQSDLENQIDPQEVEKVYQALKQFEEEYRVQSEQAINAENRVEELNQLLEAVRRQADEADQNRATTEQALLDSEQKLADAMNETAKLRDELGRARKEFDVQQKIFEARTEGAREATESLKDLFGPGKQQDNTVPPAAPPPAPESEWDFQNSSIDQLDDALENPDAAFPVMEETEIFNQSGGAGAQIDSMALVEDEKLYQAEVDQPSDQDEHLSEDQQADREVEATPLSPESEASQPPVDEVSSDTEENGEELTEEISDEELVEAMDDEKPDEFLAEEFAEEPSDMAEAVSAASEEISEKEVATKPAAAADFPYPEITGDGMERYRGTVVLLVGGDARFVSDYQHLFELAGAEANYFQSIIQLEKRGLKRHVRDCDLIVAFGGAVNESGIHRLRSVAADYGRELLEHHSSGLVSLYHRLQSPGGND